MIFFRKSIVAKLWLAMVILVLVITWTTSMVQSNIITKIYYKQQVDNIARQGSDISGAIAKGDNVGEKLRLFSEMTHANIMLVDREGFIQECHGMGMNISSEASDHKRISALGHHGDLMTGEDLNTVLSGKTVSKAGINDIINTEVLSVAVPVKKEGTTTGVVVVSHSIAAIEGQMSEYLKVIINVGIGGIILATFLSLLFSRTLSRPLIQMNNVAMGLAKGDFSRKVSLKSEDEIGVLANSLNTLSGELQEKIEDLERLDQTRKDFVAGVSHELRTPLTIIQGYAEALQDNVAESQEDRRECIEGIVEETGRLKRLVTDLLDLRRMESGQESIELWEFDAAPILLWPVEKMRPAAGEKNIELIVEVSQNTATVLANPDRLKQVLLNLLENALRYTPRGGKVSVSAGLDNGFLRVNVTDSGQGIPAGEQDLIWEKFYKVDKSRARADGAGTGLGLAIARRLVEKMGGGIRVESSPGKGTTFSFTVRAKQ